MRAGVRAFLAACACALVIGCGDLGRAELARGVESLNAIAVEGRLLAAGAIDDRSKATFTRVHARDLADRAEHEAEKLADASPAPGLEHQRDQAVDLASGISDTLGELAVKPGGEAEARRMRDELVRRADEAERLGQGLR